jgi:hypothetical protein
MRAIKKMIMNVKEVIDKSGDVVIPIEYGRLANNN